MPQALSAEERKELLKYRSVRLERPAQSASIIAATNQKIKLRTEFKNAFEDMVKFVMEHSSKTKNELPAIFQENPETWLDLTKEAYGSKQEDLKNAAIRVGAITEITSRQYGDEKATENAAYNAFHEILDRMWGLQREYRDTGRDVAKGRA